MFQESDKNVIDLFPAFFKKYFGGELCLAPFESSNCFFYSLTIWNARYIINMFYKNILVLWTAFKQNWVKQ